MNPHTRTVLSIAVFFLVVVALAAGVGVSLAAGPNRTVYLSQSVPAGHSALNNQAEMGYAGASIIQSQADVLRAQAEIIKAQAQAAEAYARVRESLEKTRSLAMDNELKVAKTFYDKRKLWEEYKSQYPRERANAEQINRYSQTGVPKRLEGYQINSRGIAYWPAVFERSEFAEDRDSLDRLFKRRQPHDAGPESDFSREVHETASEMRKDLREIIGQITPSQYVAARKFIDGLAREADTSPEIAGVAAK